MINRSRSSGDGRRRYVHLERSALDGLQPGLAAHADTGVVRVHPQLGSQPARRCAVAIGDEPPGRVGRHTSRRPCSPRRRVRGPARQALARRQRATIDRRRRQDAATGDHGVRPGTRGTRSARHLAALVDPRPRRGRFRSSVRRHGPRAPPDASTALVEHVSMPDDSQLDVEVETGTGAMRLDLHAATGRRGARHRLPDHRRDRVGNHGQPPLTQRRRPATARERGRHRRRADRPDPDARRRLRRTLQPGRHARRPAVRARSRPATACATSPPRPSAGASARSSPT